MEMTKKTSIITLLTIGSEINTRGRVEGNSVDNNDSDDDDDDDDELNLQESKSRKASTSPPSAAYLPSVE